jgi:hypothetical protein
MAAEESNAPADASAGEFGGDRRQTIVMVRSALAIACAYLILFSEGSSGAQGLGPLVIVVFLASNLVVGRLRPEVIGTQPFNVTIAVVDTVLIVLSLLCAGQLSVELVVLFLGILILAIAGLRLGIIAAATLGMSAVYMLIMWVTGNGPTIQAGTLLRLPFLLSAAMVYAWVTEAARHERSARERDTAAAVVAVTADLTLQLESITRCQGALLEGSLSAAKAALDEIAAQNTTMRATLAGGMPTEKPVPQGTPSLAHSAA